jgi:hypothetical protein
MLLTQADAYYGSHFSAWLGQQDAFNDALFRAFHAFLSSKGAPGAISTKEPSGCLIDYGNLIYHGAFTRAYPILAGHLQVIHDRRKTLPLAHPYEKRTGAKSQPLKKAEQRDLSARMTVVYKEIITEAQQLGI